MPLVIRIICTSTPSCWLEVFGSWNGWKKSLTVYTSEVGESYFSIDLDPGEYQYKVKIKNGEWFYNTYDNTIKTSEGHINNILIVPKKDDVSEILICSICLTNKKNSAFLCGHVYCGECIKTFIKCPTCKKPKTSIIKVYL